MMLNQRNATIHLNVPAATKGRWVRASRAAGMRLTDYIVDAVDAYMQQQLTQFVIPGDVKFSDLKLGRGHDGAVSFDWTPIERICAASKLPIELLRDTNEGNVATLITKWYFTHRQSGGDADLVADDLIGEVLLEDAADQHASLAPGRA